MRVFREPCYFAEAVYLLYYFVNRITYEEEYRRICQTYGRKHNEVLERRVQELMRVSAMVTEGLDPEEERLQYFFERLPETDKKNGCCLAQVMLMSIPLEYSDIDAFAEELLHTYQSMQREGIRVNDLNGMGLIMERWTAPEEQEPLAGQIERLPCGIEAKWRILRVLTEYETHLRELTEIIRPAAQALRSAMDVLVQQNEPLLEQWSQYFATHTVDDFQSEMFDSSFLFVEEKLPHEIWLGMWCFNIFGTWSEWLDRSERVRVAYLGVGISFDLAVRKKSPPDEEALCDMLRALGGKDKLEILRRCNKEPYSAAKLAAAMNLNSGTVSRNVYSLFKMGFLETNGDGKYVNYITRKDAIDYLFYWIMKYIEDGA